jgi:hypothetical protein
MFHIFPCFLFHDFLVAGDWNHGILNDFPIILGIVTPTDEVIFFRGVGIPPTSYGSSFLGTPFSNESMAISGTD